MVARVLKLEDTEIKVSKVQITGTVRTKSDIVAEQVKDVLYAKTLQELIANSLISVDKLKSLKIFKDVQLQLDTCKNKVGEVEGVKVTFNVKESGLLASSISANAGTQSGDANLSLSLRNIFGRAEQLRILSCTAFPQWGQTVQLEFTKPYYKDLNKRFNASIGTTSIKQPSSGYQEYITGQKLNFKWFSRFGEHSLLWICDWRELFGFDSNVPLSIRSEAGHSLKSSIKHVMETDNRDDPLLPTSGYHSKISQEVAGIGGNVVFSKSEIQTEWYKEIIPNWVLSLSVWCGLLKPFTPSKINDRFLLGGPTTLRGFEMWGVGPRDQGYSLGGEAYWCTGLHILTPLPYVTGELFRRIRLHGFVNAGNLTGNLISLIKGSRMSCGCGLHIRLGVAQIEINYALPLIAQSSDRLKPGLQFGIGIDML